MGAGIYIVYPAFYTDVTDSYRLGRWARVRTDLGGFYFNILFALAAMGVYALTGQEVLLLIVSLLNLEILRQLMPLTRLDGYWVLADLTGVPDFISHMGGFVRSILPGNQQQTRKLAPLKPWARVIFALYVVVTTPLLILQVLLMLRAFPRVLATGWHSAITQVEAIGQAQASGDVGGAALGVLQLLALGLPSLAILFSGFRFGQRSLRQLWRWSAASSGRRALASAAVLVALGALGWSWLPKGVSPGQGQYEPIQAEERGTVSDVVLPVQGPPVPTAQPVTPTPTAVADPTQAPTPNPGLVASPAPAASPRPADVRPSPVASPVSRIPSPTPARN
jgi:putative peptide zinc metalloprotease protein